MKCTRKGCTRTALTNTQCQNAKPKKKPRRTDENGSAAYCAPVPAGCGAVPGAVGRCQTHERALGIAAQGLEPECWSNATPIRKIFREAFEGAGLPYFNPHLFRNTLAHIGQQTCKTPEQMKAWSQNLGHENVLTTFTSYGTLDPHRQGEVIKNIGLLDKDDLIQRIRDLVR